MSTSREPDRLVLFTDAVVAIAITLLVLPLVEIVAEPGAERPAELLTHAGTLNLRVVLVSIAPAFLLLLTQRSRAGWSADSAFPWNCNVLGRSDDLR